MRPTMLAESGAGRGGSRRSSGYISRKMLDLGAQEGTPAPIGRQSDTRKGPPMRARGG